MVLDILRKGPSLYWTEENQLYDHFKDWRKRVEVLMTSMALKEKPQDFICHCIKAWSGETGHAHIEAAGISGDDVATTKCLLYTLQGNFKTRCNDTGRTTAYKQLV